MPYRSKAQQAYFHEHAAALGRQGVNVAEWDKATKAAPGGFKALPERAKAKLKGKARKR